MVKLYFQQIVKEIIGLYIQVMLGEGDYTVLLNQLIQVDADDHFIGPVDKWQAHTNSYLQTKEALPHRAFSIFIFNSKNELLFQKRSADKKTFPLCWTNTCCSHPNMVQLPNQQLAQEPIRNALHRALMRELTLQISHLPFYFMGKIYYKQEAKEVEGFGEYEVDYVFLCKLKEETLDYVAVPSEIAETKWISRHELSTFMKEEHQKEGYFSPWFSKMHSNGLLEKWWLIAESGDLRNFDGENEQKVMKLQ